MKKITLLVLLAFSILGTQKVFCQGNQYLGEIKMFAGNFAPIGWAKCEGQLLPIAQYTALFSLLGTYYGGDGKSTFALPDLRGIAPMHAGQGPGLSEFYLGETTGSEKITLLISEIPFHTHTVNAVTTNGNLSTPENTLLANTLTTDKDFSDANSDIVQLNFNTVGVTGGNQPVNNMQPYLAVTYIIALQGIFPPRQ